MAKFNFLKFIIAVTLTVGLGAISGFFTAGEISGWYATLQKPSFNPPNWLFGPVWTLLYLLMGISFYIIWNQPSSRERNTAMTLFILQFLLNFCWSFIFFKQHQLAFALAEIIALWIGIVITMVWFSKLSSAAVWLLVPYILWVSFATLLTEAIWKLN